MSHAYNVILQTILHEGKQWKQHCVQFIATQLSSSIYWLLKAFFKHSLEIFHNLILRDDLSPLFS